MTETQVLATINNYFTAISALDVEAWLETFAADAISHEPGNPPLQGHEALRQFFNGIAAGFAQLLMQPEQSFVLDNEAAVKWSARGVGRNGRTVTFEGIDFFALNDAGKLQTVRGYWNPATMMAELMAE